MDCVGCDSFQWILDLFIVFIGLFCMDWVGCVSLEGISGLSVETNLSGALCIHSLGLFGVSVGLFWVNIGSLCRKKTVGSPLCTFTGSLWVVYRALLRKYWVSPYKEDCQEPSVHTHWISLEFLYGCFEWISGVFAERRLSGALCIHSLGLFGVSIGLFWENIGSFYRK